VAWLSEPRPDFGQAELLPVVVQDADTGEVLMLAWANDQALAATERSREAHFWSRSRNALWRKGATSGNVMHVAELATDCDGDAILYRVRPTGPACHTGARSCFAGERPFTLRDLEDVIADRRNADPGSSYTARLLAAGPGRPALKLIEEASELATAALARSDADVRHEAADVAYHLLVLLASCGVTVEQVEATLAERHRQ